MINALSVIWSFRRLFGYAILLGVIGWLWVANAGLEKNLLKQKIRYTDLAAQVERQNAQIEAYKVVAKKSAAAAEKALKEARVVEKFHASKATRILVSLPTNSDECVAALELLREYQ
jgi:hypothetical protein